MTGFVKPRQAELRLRDMTVYQGLYCGLCRHMGKCTGQCSRVTLRYDYVFMASVRMILTGDVPTVKKGYCPYTCRIKPTVKEKNETLSYVSDVSAILSHHKLLDDLHDEKGFKKATAMLGCLLLSSAYKKAKKRRPLLDKAVAEGMDAFYQCEKDCADLPSLDAPADAFGRVMGLLFSYGLTEENALLARAIGEVLGKIVYILDALDDYREDVKKKRFNPLIALYGTEATAEQLSTVYQDVDGQLIALQNAVGLLPATGCELNAVTDNIAFFGLYDAKQNIQNKGKKK